MTRRAQLVAAALALAGCSASLRADEVRPPGLSWAAGPAADAYAAEPAPIDPDIFFQQLVERYRELDQYEDTASVEHVTAHDGVETQRSQTQIATMVDGEELEVRTPLSTLREQFSLTAPRRALAAIRRGYELWLAPHMALRYSDEPLREFRAGVESGFTPTGAEHVELNRKPMVHLELRSSPPSIADDQQPDHEACEARFDLYVNPDSMLIERIEGEQRLADGSVIQTTVQITPIRARGGSVNVEMQPEDASRGRDGAAETPATEPDEADDSMTPWMPAAAPAEMFSPS